MTKFYVLLFNLDKKHWKETDVDLVSIIFLLTNKDTTSTITWYCLVMLYNDHALTCSFISLFWVCTTLPSYQNQNEKN